MPAVAATVGEVVDEALGRRHRTDPVVGRSGGPAGNARLTAWTGLLLLVLFLAELYTVLDVEGLITWHVALGAILVPVALLKTASTSWRVGRYYTGHAAYRTAGPPPTPLRVLGPLVVLTTLGLLGTGLDLIALGPRAGRQPFVTVLGFAVDPLTLHQAFFIAFAVATGLHLLARLVPAVRLAAGRVGRAVPGRTLRLGTVAIGLAAAALAAVLVVGARGSWGHDGDHHGHDRPGVAAGSRT